MGSQVDTMGNPMIVTCESCQTRFRLDPDRIKGTSSKVRCSRCGHIFQVIKEELQFEPEILEADTATEMDDDDFRLSAKRSHPRPLTSPKSIHKAQKRKIKYRLLIWLGVIVLLAGGAFLLVKKSFLPSQGTAPVVGVKRSLTIATQKPNITILEPVQAYFLENENIGQIFIVEGAVRNDYTNPVSFVLLEGKLYTTDNKVYQTQKFYCGNIMSREELTRLKVADLQNRMMNREGKDLVNVHIAPQGQVPCMVVFHNLPGLQQLSDYSIGVVNVDMD
jgi:predicted Zn finger-like uncharacterized protein